MNKADFLARVQTSAALESRREAERRCKAVVSALAQMLPDSAARRHFASQLPGFLKSHLLAERPRYLKMTGEAFLQHVGHALDVHAPEAQRALSAVWRGLRGAVSAGEIAAIETHVPKEIAALLRR